MVVLWKNMKASSDVYNQRDKEEPQGCVWLRYKVPVYFSCGSGLEKPSVLEIVLVLWGADKLSAVPEERASSGSRAVF